MYILSNKLLLSLFMQIIGLFFSAAVDSYVGWKQRRNIFMMAALVSSLVAQNMGESVFADSGRTVLLTALEVYGCTARPVLLILFLSVVGGSKKELWAWIAAGANALIHLTAFFSPVCFRIGESGLIRGPLGWTAPVVSGVLLVWLAVATVRQFGENRKIETLIPLFNVILLAAASAADIWIARTPPVSHMTVTAVSACLLYYIWLHIRFVREHERALLAEQRIQIVKSQIQPHFLYNTLSTIQALCRTEPDKAFDTLGKFGVYLRQNLDSLDAAGLIPFSKELAHTKVYAEIESIRFPNIRIEYDIGDGDFMVPALTLQPLVENAIRHGVRIRKEGVVAVSAKKTPEGHEIVIRDNGRGFDPNAPLPDDGRAHIGIANARERIETLCGGELRVQSVIGEGTVVTILIPKEGKGA